MTAFSGSIEECHKVLPDTFSEPTSRSWAKLTAAKIDSDTNAL
jgi:hypothetical protein